MLVLVLVLVPLLVLVLVVLLVLVINVGRFADRGTAFSTSECKTPKRSTGLIPA